MKKLKIQLLFVLLNIALVSAQNITQGELLGRPTATSITVQAFFDENVEVSIQYGTVSGVYSGQTNWQLFLVNDPAEIIVSGLEANTKYY